MINPHIKNRRTGCHDDIFNRNCHYLRVLNTKSTIDNKQSQVFLLRKKKQKLNHENPDIIAKQNNSIMKKIISLQRSPSSYAV